MPKPIQRTARLADPALADEMLAAVPDKRQLALLLGLEYRTALDLLLGRPVRPIELDTALDRWSRYGPEGVRRTFEPLRRVAGSSAGALDMLDVVETLIDVVGARAPNRG